MSDNKIVQHMIDFIGEKERELQSEMYQHEKKQKTDVVKLILNELESEIENENPED